MRGPSSREGTLRDRAGGEDRKWVGADSGRGGSLGVCREVVPSPRPEVAQRFSPDHHRAPPSADWPDPSSCSHMPGPVARQPPALQPSQRSCRSWPWRGQLTLRPRTIIAMNPTPRVSPRSVPRKGPGSPHQGLTRPPGPQHLPSSDERGGQDGQHDTPTPVRLPAVPVPGLLGDRVSTDHLVFR